MGEGERDFGTLALTSLTHYFIEYVTRWSMFSEEVRFTRVIQQKGEQASQKAVV